VPRQFGYEPGTCDATVSMVAGYGGAALCDTSSVYMTYAPYGLWDLEVLGRRPFRRHRRPLRLPGVAPAERTRQLG
jgi:hypothetical protein